ncbi:MAG: PAS domain S-box protein, partial [Desulfonatronovibrionaceae bacterium]
IFEDITDQVRTRQNLEIKEHQLREVVENQTELICRFLPDGTLTFVNEAYCRYFGKTRDELLGRRFTPLIHDQDKNLVYRMFTSLCPEKPQVSYEHRVIMPSGEVRWQHWTDQAFFDSQGKPSEIQAVGRDITEQKLAQEALQESEKRYRALVESQNDLIVRVDPENRLTYVNDTYCRTFGKTREELIGQSFTPLVHEDDIEPTLKAMEGLKKPPYRAQMEQRAMTVSGWRWLHWEDNSILDEKGNIVEIQGVGRDITELKNKQETLQSIFQASQEVSFIITDCNPDGNNTIREFSPGSEIIFGYSREEILGKPIQMLHSSSDQEIFTEILNRLQQNSSWRGQVRLVRKNGREFPALFTVHPFELHGEKATLGVSIDITELEEARQELVQARKKAESANRAKSMFLANMSHEIRTPLNAVLGFAQILQRDAALTAQQKEHVKIISRSGSHLLGIINDILDMSRIEAGRMETKPEDFSLSALLEDITLMFQSRARIKGLELGLEEDSGLPGFIRTDQGMLRQILINLLGNAVKFTDSGRVDIRAFCPGGQDRICISVTDTGPGIDRKELEFLFKPFQQTMEGHRQGGTGLGLSISREYARFLGGDIEVESTPGQGSTFSLALPVQKALSRPERSATKPPCATGIKPGYSPPRVLLVDDSWYNRAYLTALLKPLGFVVQEAQDGHQALEVFKKWHPQVILMNMRMPGLNGCQATKSVRRNENRVKPLIIAITAHATTSTKDEALNCGADYFLSKPFEPHELLEILGRELGLEYEYIRHSEADAPEKPEKAQENRSEEWPGHIIQALRQTLDDGDMADFRKNLKELAGIDPDSASLMQKLAGAYDYQELDRIISRAEEQL